MGRTPLGWSLGSASHRLLVAPRANAWKPRLVVLRRPQVARRASTPARCRLGSCRVARRCMFCLVCVYPNLHRDFGAKLPIPRVSLLHVRPSWAGSPLSVDRNWPRRGRLGSRPTLVDTVRRSWLREYIVSHEHSTTIRSCFIFSPFPALLPKQNHALRRKGFKFPKQSARIR